MEAKIVVVDDAEKTSLWISRRELRIIQCIQEGCNNKEIADELGIAEKTVETHRHNILKRLGCRNAPHLITVLFRQGILS